MENPLHQERLVMSTPQTALMERAGDGMRTAYGVGGLIAIVLGMLILVFPAVSGAATMTVIAAIVAAYVLVSGVTYIGSALFTRSMGGWERTGHVLLGVLFLLGGGAMILNLGLTAVTLAVFLSVTVGILWVLEGIMAFTVAARSTSKVWSVVYGVISLLAGLALIISPLLSAVTLWILLGASMLVIGVVQVVRAFKVKPVRPA